MHEPNQPPQVVRITDMLTSASGRYAAEVQKTGPVVLSWSECPDMKIRLTMTKDRPLLDMTGWRFDDMDQDQNRLHRMSEASRILNLLADDPEVTAEVSYRTGPTGEGRARYLGSVEKGVPYDGEGRRTDAADVTERAGETERRGRWLKASEAPEAEVTDWLIPDRLARGHFTYLFGEEGIGKSTWWVYIVAQLTQRGENVVLLITEDGWRDGVRPRLEAARVDLDRVYMLDVAEDAGDFEMGLPGPQYLTDDTELPDIALVVIDGLADAATEHSGKLPKPNEWRPIINRWKRYARTRNAAVLALGHTNRDTLNGTRGAVGLSGQIRQTIRHNLLAQQDEDGRLAIGVEKSNLGRTDGPVELFEVTEAETPGGVKTTVVMSVGFGDQSAQGMFSTIAAKPKTAEDEAEGEQLDGCVGDLVEIVERESNTDGWITRESAAKLLETGKGESRTRWSASQINRARTKAIKEKWIETKQPSIPGPHYWRRIPK